MSEFLTPLGLAQKLVDKTGVSLEIAKKFSSVFFSIVKNQLKKFDSFSLYNFGTFRKTWIETTWGINPSNGEKIQIPAHYRIKFAPCAAVARRINRKYSLLKPSPVFDAPEAVETSTIPAAIPVEDLKINEEESLLRKAEKLKSEADEVQEQSETEKNVSEEISAVTENLVSEPAAVIQMENAEENQPENGETSVPETVENEKKTDAEETVSEENKTAEAGEKSEKRSRKTWKIFVILGIIAALILVLVAVIINCCTAKKAAKGNKAILKIEGMGDSWKDSAKTEAKTEEKAAEEQLEKTDENKPAAEENLQSEETTEAESPSAEENTTAAEEKLPESEETAQSAETTEPDSDEIAAEIQFEEFTVPYGSSYHQIAVEKYNNAHLWPYVYSLNKAVSPDPDLIVASHNINIPDKPDLQKNKAAVCATVLEAYNGYLLMCEKQPESKRNAERKRLAIRVIVSGEILYPGFIKEYKDRILPEYAEQAQNIADHQYK